MLLRRFRLFEPRLVKIFFLCILILVNLGVYFTFSEPVKVQATAVKPVSVATATIILKPSTPVASAPVVSTPITPTVATVVSAVAAPSPAPNCTPDTSYSAPTAITPQGSGLEQVIDTPSTYTVYGNTPSQIAAQIAACTPVHSTGTNGTAGNYAASTANTINWQVSFTDNGSGLCSVASANVTLHINQVFPQWQATSGSPSSLSGIWQTYLSKLETYEQGHTQLDETAAQTILNDLQNLPATSCNTIDQVANTQAESDSANNLTANANYDTLNNFGLKQNVTL